MADLFLGGQARPVTTVFGLLGRGEDDLTRSLAWALSASDRLRSRVLALLDLPFDAKPTHRLRTQHSLTGHGRTDIEIEAGDALVIFEAKLGWALPDERQVRQYERRIEHAVTDHVAADVGQPVSRGALVTLSECSAEWAERHLPPPAADVTRRHLTWTQVIQAAEAEAGSGPHSERRLLRELADYLRSTTQMRDDPASQMTWVVPINRDQPDHSQLNFLETVQAGRYYNVVGKAPKEAFNFIAFRWDSALREVRFVERRELFTDPQEAMPDIFTAPGRWGEHELFTLGPPIKPAQPVPYGKLFAPGYHRALLDCLLTSATVAEARDRSQQRFAEAGLPF